jgi:hypothetical protein
VIKGITAMEEKNDIVQEIENYKKIGLFKKPKKQLINFLDLREDEKILINLRLFPLKSIFINNVRERYAKRLILTTERIIFIIDRGYLFKEFFPYSEITETLVTRKWYTSGEIPVVIIKTVNNNYEILFATPFSYKKKIGGIVNCIKRMNPGINIEITPKYEENFLKEVLFTKIKFK